MAHKSQARQGKQTAQLQFPESKLGNALSISHIPYTTRLIGAKTINANCSCTKFFENPSGHGRPRRKSWTSAQKSAFFCGPGDGEKLSDPGASGRGSGMSAGNPDQKVYVYAVFLPRNNLQHAACNESYFSENLASKNELLVLAWS